MSGTFCEGDILFIETWPFAKVRRGDVVAFRGQAFDGTRRMLVHRVVAGSSAEGWVTQGDNCFFPDEAVIRAEDFFGRVTAFQRHDKQYSTPGGALGLLWARVLRVGRGLLRRMGRPYHSLRASGLLQALAAPFLSEIHLTTSDGPHVKYLLGGRSVAIWLPAQGYFSCRKPYDLFVPHPGNQT